MKNRVSIKELKKTDRKKKDNYYPKERTDYGKNGTSSPANLLK